METKCCLLCWETAYCIGKLDYGVAKNILLSIISEKKKKKIRNKKNTVVVAKSLQ